MLGGKDVGRRTGGGKIVIGGLTTARKERGFCIVVGRGFCIVLTGTICVRKKNLVQFWCVDKCCENEYVKMNT